MKGTVAITLRVMKSGIRKTFVDQQQFSPNRRFAAPLASRGA